MTDWCIMCLSRVLTMLSAFLLRTLEQTLIGIHAEVSLAQHNAIKLDSLQLEGTRR